MLSYLWRVGDVWFDVPCVGEEGEAEEGMEDRGLVNLVDGALFGPSMAVNRE